MLLAAMAIEIIVLGLKVYQLIRSKRNLLDEVMSYAQWLMPVIVAMRLSSKVKIPPVDEFLWLYVYVTGGMAGAVILLAAIYSAFVDFKA